MSKIGVIRIKSCSDYIALVPYLLGYVPSDSLVCIMLGDSHITVATRLDLAELSDPATAQDAIAQTTSVLMRYGSAAVLIGYGHAEQAEPAVDLFAAALKAATIDIHCLLRFDEGRYWRLDGEGGDGIVYDPATSAIAVQAVVSGLAPFASRAALEESIAPITGPEHDRLAAAAVLARERLDAMVQDDSIALADIVAGAISAVRQALESAAQSQTLSDEALMWLIYLLRLPQVRDYAWHIGDGKRHQRQLWAELTRRAPAPLAPAPAFLLAVNAYLAGDGLLAGVAVDRALDQDPDYWPARLLNEALAAGMHPKLWKAMTDHISLF